MEILFVSPEVVPFSKVGGLGDVTGSLPKALRALGHKVTVVSPLYGTIDPNANSLARRLAKVQVPLGGQVVAAEVYEAKLPSGVNVTLLNAPGLTDRQAVYGEADDYKRFAFLSRAAIEWARMQPKLPDVIHAHDWTTGLVPLFLKAGAAADPRLAQVRSVFTAHNFDGQGLFEAAALAEIGVPMSYFTPSGVEFYGKASSIKAGIVYADRVTTVSPTYAREVLAGQSGGGMDGVVRARGKDFVGILNGIDFAVWNPATDPHLAARYDAEDASAKQRCKADLAAAFGLPPRPDAPLFGMVARLEASKGVDLVLAAAAKLMRQDLTLVVLGDGDGALGDGLAQLAARFPERVAFKRGFDEALAHKVYGGSDFFLAPSRVEPCGLAHLYAMRYGAVPVVRATGGLRDTVIDADMALESGTGFVFEQPDADELYGAMARCLVAFKDRAGLARLRHRGMRRDFSWDRSARQYQTLYASLVSGATVQPGA